MKKRGVVLFLLICLVATGAFAYDGTIYGGYDGSFSRYSFIQQCQDGSAARSVVDALKPTSVDKFFQVTEDNADQEDVQLIEDVWKYICNNYKVNDKDAFSHIVVRTQSDEQMDGWVVLTHCSESAQEPVLHYIYYFSVSW